MEVRQGILAVPPFFGGPRATSRRERRGQLERQVPKEKSVGRLMKRKETANKLIAARLSEKSPRRISIVRLFEIALIVSVLFPTNMFSMRVP